MTEATDTLALLETPQAGAAPVGGNSQDPKSQHAVDGKLHPRRKLQPPDHGDWKQGEEEIRKCVDT